MKYLLLGIFAFLLIHSPASAQFSSVDVGIDGLTCSLCARSVEESVKQLDFVSRIEMKLGETRMLVHFKPKAEVNWWALSQRVRDAGFSVRYIRTDLNFNKLKIQGPASFSLDNTLYKVADTFDPPLKGTHTVQFIGADFQTRKAFKQWKEKWVEQSPDSPSSYSQVYYLSK